MTVARSVARAVASPVARAVGAGIGSRAYFLDSVANAVAAYSLRTLSAATTDTILARRSSDNAEEGFSESEITGGSLLAWAGAGDAFIKTWYDQTGLGRDATQTTTTLQPKIVESGVLVTKNGKPAIKFDGTDDRLDAAATVGTIKTSMIVANQNADVSGAILGWSYDNSYSILRFSGRFYAKGTIDSINGLSSYSSDLKLFTTLFGGDALYVNGSSIASGPLADPSGAPKIGYRTASSTPGAFWNGNIQEILIFSDDKSSERAAIEANLNSHYGIF